MSNKRQFNWDAWLTSFDPAKAQIDPGFIRAVAADVVAEVRRRCERADKQFKSFISARELRAKEFPPMRWANPGLVAEGLTILAGRPKMGKSMLALNIAYDIASGGRVLGSIAADKGDVFMYSLEDPLPRVQKRLAAMSEDADAEWPEALHVSRVASMIASQATPVKTGLLGELEELVSAYPATRLIIVDHLGVVMPEDEAGKRRYGLDLKVLHPLQQWAVERRVALMFLTHCRKPSSKGETDPLDEIIESTGRTAVADTVLVLKRGRGLEGETTLAVRSKDVDAEEIKLTFDREHCRYTSKGGVESIISEWMRPIYTLLKDNPEGMLPKDIAFKLDKSQDTIRGQLKRMVEAGVAGRRDDGRYALKGARVTK